jgi:hypothetical protein
MDSKASPLGADTLMKNPFAILRVIKLKSRAEIAAMAHHWLRTRPTLNSDPKRRNLNRTVLGGENPHLEFNKKMKEKGITKFRKNGVLLLEFVLTFSPEYIRDSSTGKYLPDANQRVKKWLTLSKQWIIENYGENCISVIYHGDETTPHLHVAVCPIELKTWKNGKQNWALNARAITGGAKKLSNLQDLYSLALAPTGLIRGLKKSVKTRHSTLKQFYGAIESSKDECEALNLPSPQPTPEGFNTWRKTMNNIITALQEAQQDDYEHLRHLIEELAATNKKLKQQLEQKPSQIHRP